MSDPLFLDFEAVLELHRDSLRKFGGTDGIREQHLVESALGSAITRAYMRMEIYTILLLLTDFILLKPRLSLMATNGLV